MYAVVASASGSSSWNKWKWREPISSTSPSGGTKPSTVSSDSLRNDGREARFEQKGRNREDERYDSRNGSRADGDARARRRILGHRGPADERANERDEHRRCHPARFVRVLYGPVGGNDGGDDAARRGSGSLAKRSYPRCAHSAAVRRVVPCRLDTRGRRNVCALPAARLLRGRRVCDRCGGLRAHAAQTALPPALPRERRLWIRVRALLRRVEHRTDGDAGGAEHHERHLNVRDRRPRSRPEAPACESRHRRAGGAGHRRTWTSDRHSALVGSWAHATDVIRHRWCSLRQPVVTRKERTNDRSQDRNT